jgi:hypothetical protein
MILDFKAVPRDGLHAPRRRVRRKGGGSQATGEKYDWAVLVLATWDLPAGWQHHGRLPEGWSQQNFRAMVVRAAQRMHGEVEVRVRGEEWWIWSRRRGKAPATRAGMLLGARSRWDGIRQAVARADGGPVRVEGVLDADDQRRLKAAASARWGMVIAVEVRGDVTIVQEIGAV